jgi:AcrR family transcriptional regulator
MTETRMPTRERIVAAAAKLFYSEGVRAVSVDAIAEKAGVTKRTLYYHFTSKDEVIAAYLAARDQPNLALFRRWFEAADGDVGDRVAAIFDHLAENARSPKWKGCGFLRTSAELAHLPGHPAIKIGAAHKRGFEDWLAEIFSVERLREPRELARQVLILLDGAFSVVLLHRDATYLQSAGNAARSLIRAAAAQVD